MKMNNRFIYGILSIILAVIIAFVAIPAITRKTSATMDIVRVTAPVEKGSLISPDAIELVTVGGYNLPENVAFHLEDVSGFYAAADLSPGDYILSEKVSATPLSSDLTLNEIPDGTVAMSVTTRTLAAALSDKLQGGDIIRFYYYNDRDEFTPVTDIPELRFLKLLSVTDSKGLDVDYTELPEEDEEKLQTATVTVLATPEQAMLLTRYENEGMLHVALISRGNESLANDLLKRQSEILTTLYGDGTEVETELESSFTDGSETSSLTDTQPEATDDAETANQPEE